MRTARKLSARTLAAIGVLLVPTAMFAQTPPKPAQPAPPEVMEPPGENPAPPSDPSTGGAEPTKPLTKELREGEGVLEPPRGVDPKIEKKPPEDFEGKTPVIPPPGEPGGREDLQPK
jgi:hypothetical protein